MRLQIEKKEADCVGLRFRKSFKLAPGVKLNIGSKSVGISMGGKYGGVSVNSRTGARARVSAPGTGLSYTSRIGSTTSTSSTSHGSTAGSSVPMSNGSAGNGSNHQRRPRKWKGLRWILAVFMGFSGIVFFPSTASIAMLLFAVAVVPIPVIDAFLSEKLKLRGGLRTLALVALFISAVMMVPISETTPPPESSSIPELVIVDELPEDDIPSIASENSAGTLDESIQDTTPDNNADTIDDKTTAEHPSTDAQAPSSNAATVTPPSDASASTAGSTDVVQPSEPPKSPDPQPTPQPNPTNEETVYVTPTGKRYHYDSKCGNGSYSETTLSRAQNMGLSPCHKCAGG